MSRTSEGAELWLCRCRSTWAIFCLQYRHSLSIMHTQTLRHTCTVTVMYVLCFWSCCSPPPQQASHVVLVCFFSIPLYPSLCSCVCVCLSICVLREFPSVACFSQFDISWRICLRDSLTPLLSVLPLSSVFLLSLSLSPSLVLHVCLCYSPCSFLLCAVVFMQQCLCTSISLLSPLFFDIDAPHHCIPNTLQECKFTYCATHHISASLPSH